jgi:hypothetical protein
MKITIYILEVFRLRNTNYLIIKKVSLTYKIVSFKYISKDRTHNMNSI